MKTLLCLTLVGCSGCVWSGWIRVSANDSGYTLGPKIPVGPDYSAPADTLFRSQLGMCAVIRNTGPDTYYIGVNAGRSQRLQLDHPVAPGWTVAVRLTDDTHGLFWSSAKREVLATRPQSIERLSCRAAKTTYALNYMF